MSWFAGRGQWCRARRGLLDNGKGGGGEKQRPARTVPRGTWAQAGALRDWQAARYDVPGVRVGHLRVGFFNGRVVRGLIPEPECSSSTQEDPVCRARRFTVTHARAARP